jgi:tetratricopeptide (TPR) repeat protein
VFCLLGGVSLLLAPSLSAAPATVHLKSGREVKIDLISVDSAELKWRLDSLSANVQTMPLEQIDYVEFPPLPAFRLAMEAFGDDNFKRAAELLEPIAGVQYSGNYYPAPGNYSTLARRRLIDCYRHLADAPKIAEHLVKLEKDLLPPAERALGSLVDCWAAVGAEEWEGALEIADAAKDIDPVSPEGVELAFLKGTAYSALGKEEDALTELSKAYTLNLGADARYIEPAAKKAGEILLHNEERLPELKGVLQYYSKVYRHDGRLWEGAGDELNAVAALGLETRDVAQGWRPEEPGTMPESPAPQPEPTASATAPAEPAADAAAAPAPATVGELFRVSLDPENAALVISDPKKTLETDADGVHWFKSANKKQTLTLPSHKLEQEFHYEARAKYRFSITTHMGGKRGKNAQCALQFLSWNEAENRQEVLKEWKGKASLNGKLGLQNRKPNSVTFEVPSDSPAVGRTMIIRMFSTSREVRFHDDGVVELLP